MLILKRGDGRFVTELHKGDFGSSITKDQNKAKTFNTEEEIKKELWRREVCIDDFSDYEMIEI